MNNIEWKDGAVCYAGEYQRKIIDGEMLRLMVGEWVPYSIGASIKDPIDFRDFQLNEPLIGDYLPKSELDTEQKYNDAVEVFGLFGCAWVESACEKYGAFRDGKILIWSDGLHQASDFHNGKKRKLTYSQLMAIGKLKRLMNEREIKQAVKSRINAELDKPKSAKQYLNECIDVQNQRGEQYDSTGTGERSFDAAAKAYNALTGGSLKDSDVCLLLTCVKAVRQYSNPNRLHEDSLLDGVSYLSLWAEELNKELTNGKGE